MFVKFLIKELFSMTLQIDLYSNFLLWGKRNTSLFLMINQ